MSIKKNIKPQNIVNKSAARIAAVQIFYNLLASNKSLDQSFSEYKISFKKDLENQFNIKSLDNNYLSKILCKFDNSYEKIIEKYLTKNWKIERISSVDKAILFSGMIELQLNISLSKNIIISEYLEIADQMGGETKFINKVLDQFTKDSI